MFEKIKSMFCKNDLKEIKNTIPGVTSAFFREKANKANQEINLDNELYVQQHYFVMHNNCIEEIRKASELGRYSVTICCSVITGFDKQMVATNQQSLVFDTIAERLKEAGFKTKVSITYSYIAVEW